METLSRQSKAMPFFSMIHSRRPDCRWLLAGIAGSFAFVGCTREVEPIETSIPEITVTATVETAPSPLPNSDADDPAFWFHPTDSSKNLVLACQKEGGYSVYDVFGKTLADERPGEVRFNNVAVIEDFPLAGGSADLAVFTDRFSDNLAIFRITAEAPYLHALTVESGQGGTLFNGKPGEDTAYGVAAYQDSYDGNFYAVATQNDTNRVVLVQLLPTAEGGLRWEPRFRFILEGGTAGQHAEGVVFDPLTRRLLIAQEDAGLYAVEIDSLEATTDPITLPASAMRYRLGDHGLTADLEGIDWIDDAEGPGWLLLSSQGNNRFFVMRRDTLAPVAMVHIAAGETIDGSEECDGLAATARPWGPLFPEGVLIVHDGQETPNPKLPEELTNFKWIRWEAIRDQLPR
jgi:myo-inositol-hexaphosphate 3-phosphohydrolase